MKKSLTTNGNIWQHFPISVLELLEINPEVDLIDINIEGNKLIIKKAGN